MKDLKSSIDLTSDIAKENNEIAKAKNEIAKESITYGSMKGLKEDKRHYENLIKIKPINYIFWKTN